MENLNIEFTKGHVLNFLRQKCAEWGSSISENSLGADIDVLVKTYLRPKKKVKSIEDDFSGLLIDFDLLQEFDKSGEHLWFRMESQERDTLPVEILLYAILDQEAGSASISLRKLLNDDNGIGMVFALNENGLMKKINELLAKFPAIVFSDDAGIRELQFQEPFDKYSVLQRYYGG